MQDLKKIKLLFNIDENSVTVLLYVCLFLIGCIDLGVIFMTSLKILCKSCLLFCHSPLIVFQMVLSSKFKNELKIANINRRSVDSKDDILRRLFSVLYRGSWRRRWETRRQHWSRKRTSSSGSPWRSIRRVQENLINPSL